MQKDVRDLLVSAGKAKSDYGVVLDETTLDIDVTATAKLRAKLRKARGGYETFTYGPVPEAIGVVAQRPAGDAGGNGNGVKAKKAKKVAA